MVKWLPKIFFVLLSLLFCSTIFGQASSLQVAQQAALLGTESPALSAFLQRSASRGASPDFVLQVLQNAKKMQEKGLPIEPYLLKANEGLAKGVPPQKIFPALSQTQKQLELADHLVQRAVDRGAVVDSPQERQEATLRFQKALLNQIPSNTLERLSDRVDPRTGARVTLREIGVEASALPKAMGGRVPPGQVKKSGGAFPELLHEGKGTGGVGNFEKKPPKHGLEHELSNQDSRGREWANKKPLNAHGHGFKNYNKNNKLDNNGSWEGPGKGEKDFSKGRGKGKEK
jgi:hypothetical protein